VSQLTESQAYLAMFAFLRDHYSRTGSDDLGALLGDLLLLSDGSPSDPAVKSDWAKAVSEAKAGRVSAIMKLAPK
jgi:hypothetical protein